MGWQKWWVETVSTWVLKTATQLFYTHTAITKYLAFFFIRSGGQSGIQSVFVYFFMVLITLFMIVFGLCRVSISLMVNEVV